MYNTILYPTDGSPGSDAAAEHVQYLASTFDATVHVLHVVDTRHTGWEWVVPSSPTTALD